MKLLPIELISQSRGVDILFRWLSRFKNITFINEPSDDVYVLYSRLGTVYNFPHNYDPAKMLPLRIRDDLALGKCKLIIFNDTDESNSTPNNYFLAKELTKYYNVPKENLLFITQNCNTETALKIYKSVYSEIWFSYYGNVEVKNKDERSKKFLYLCGRPRQHRVEFLYHCLQMKGFADNSYYSNMYANFTLSNGNKVVLEERLLDIPSSVINIHPVDEDLINDSYWNIVASTMYEFMHQFKEINEKEIRPIGYMMPFIILGQPLTLKLFRDYGYKTFSDWIDESYDTELDDNTRMQKILKEVEKLNNLSLEEHRQMRIDMMNVLVHNKNLHTKRHDEQYYHFKLYNNICEKLNLPD